MRHPAPRIGEVAIKGCLKALALHVGVTSTSHVAYRMDEGKKGLGREGRWIGGEIGGRTGRNRAGRVCCSYAVAVRERGKGP